MMMQSGEFAPYYLFGIGPRPKFIYCRGRLFSWPSGQTVFEEPVVRERYDASGYCLTLETKSGRDIVIRETETELSYQSGTDEARTLAESATINLPSFQSHPWGEYLRALHYEILLNIVGSEPVPNFLVYPRAWYRDAAMMAMVLKETGNERLIEEWVLNLGDPFDRNNGNEEPDNLGQALYLVSLFADSRHPLASVALREVERFRKESFIEGVTDGALHPVYQTKWLKFGTRALGLEDRWVSPLVEDSYDRLFWWAFRDRDADSEKRYFPKDERYPYLTWAEANYLDFEPPIELAGPKGAFPMTWEIEASKAFYTNLSCIDEALTRVRLAAPHTWHAAEMFLYLYRRDGPEG